MTEYIKREDVHLALDSHYFTGELSLRETIDSVPSADVVERKKGKWGDNTKDESWECSEWGFIFYSVGFYKIYNTKFGMRFCPNCGADMRHPDD